jgi:regulator of protease activity HflC (stomatin/prohibitin superfamily)
MNATVTTLTCLIGGVLVIVFIIVANAIRIVPEYQRLVVFRLGRCVGAKGPGIVFLIPIIDRAVKADLREQVREIPPRSRSTSCGTTRCSIQPKVCCRLETSKPRLRVWLQPRCVR